MVLAYLHHHHRPFIFAGNICSAKSFRVRAIVLLRLNYCGSRFLTGWERQKNNGAPPPKRKICRPGLPPSCSLFLLLVGGATAALAPSAAPLIDGH